MKSRKPLVHWCRWNSASLRLAGRDERFVWGEFGLDGDRAEPFRFDMITWTLTRTVEGAEIVETLDEMGIAREQPPTAPPSPTTT